MSKKLLIIFVRNPVLGKVKTRLAKTMGDEMALSIYFQLLRRTQQVTKDLDIDKVVYYNDFIEPDDLWSSGAYQKAVQQGGDLGEKMATAFEQAFADGYGQVAIIGSDCMDLTPEIIEEAFGALDKKDAVVGAAKDGGYYLLGMSQFKPKIFQNKAWSTDEVFISTLEDFEGMKMSYHELPVLEDIDTEKDIGPWANVFNTDYLAD